jgi:hypothetical protein
MGSYHARLKMRDDDPPPAAPVAKPEYAIRKRKRWPSAPRARSTGCRSSCHAPDRFVGRLWLHDLKT